MANISRQDLVRRPDIKLWYIDKSTKASKLLRNTFGMLTMENGDLKDLSVQLGCATDGTLHKPHILPPSIQELDLSLPDVQSEHPLSLLQKVKL